MLVPTLDRDRFLLRISLQGMRRMLGMVVAVSLVSALAGCGDDEGPDDPTQAPAAFELPIGKPSYDVDAPSWAVRTEIRVGDASITAEPAPDVYVVTRSGIYYVAQQTLYFTDGGPAEKVAKVDATSLAVSPDQQRLALIDAAHGTEDPYGAHVAVPVVFDLGTGEQVFRGVPGRSPEDDDLAVLYSELPPGVLGLDEGAVYAADPLQDADQTRFPLDGSKPEPVTGNPMLPDEAGIHGYAKQLPGGRFEWSPTFTDEGDGMYPAVLSPAQDVFFATSEQGGAFYDVESGEPTVFSETPFYLGGWIDDDTFYGAFSDRGSSEGASGRTTIASCDVRPQPTCTPLAELDLPQRPVLVFGTGNDPVL
jgi:hypothetical protein